MKKRLAALALLVLACCAATPEPDSFRAIKRSMDQVVRLVDYETRRVYCSGAVVEGLILTAAHCVEGDRIVWIEWGDKFFPALRERTDLTNDLATLIAPGLGKGLSLAKAAPDYGDKIYILGHPLGEYTESITHGYVSNPRRVGIMWSPALVWMQHTAPQEPGNSGSPVLDRRGRVVGVVSFAILSEAPCIYGPGVCGSYLRTSIRGAIHFDPTSAIFGP